MNVPRISEVQKMTLCLLIGLLTFSAVMVQAKPLPLIAIEETIAPNGNTVLRLYSRKTGRTLWKQTEGYFGKRSYSPDGKAFVMFVGTSNRYQSSENHLLVWRKGIRPRLLPPDLRAVADDAMEFIWSPDNKRVLFRVSSSGGFDANIGSLYCLNLTKMKVYSVTQGAVRKMSWSGTHRPLLEFEKREARWVLSRTH